MKKVLFLVLTVFVLSNVSFGQWQLLKAKKIKGVDSIQVGGQTFGKEDLNKACKTYLATLQQDTTANPVVTIIRNELGYEPVWTRTATGSLVVSTDSTFRGIFTLYKTVIEFSNMLSSTESSFHRFMGYPYNTDTLKIYTYDTTKADNLLRKGYNWVKIQVYE